MIQQLKAVDLFVELFVTPKSGNILSVDSKTLLKIVRKVPIREVLDAKMSNTHRDISDYFRLIGLQHRSGVAAGPYNIDMLIGDGGYAVEVDGPAHFYQETVMLRS